MNLICFTHSDYTGSENPVLSCKTCCQIFLAALKVHQAKKQEVQKDQREWMLGKVHEARKAVSASVPRSAVQPK